MKQFKLEDLLDDSSSELTGEEIKSNQSMDDIMIDRMNEYLEQEPEIPDYIINDPEVVGYPDEYMQDEIYQWVYSSLHGFGSIKDVGCGRGDFGNYLKNQTWPNSFDYIGIDRTKLIIDAGMKKYPELNLICNDWMNIIDATDYTVCIGSLNHDDGSDRYDRFWSVFDHSRQTTNKKIIFVFSTEPEEGFVHYELNRILHGIPEGYPFDIDCSRYKGICKLVFYCQKFQ